MLVSENDWRWEENMFGIMIWLWSPRINFKSKGQSRLHLSELVAFSADCFATVIWNGSWVPL